ncbi:hypothetical protein OHB07_11390 [Streptomyces sp. NBC_00111]|uniref:hypothetical protein n=1 Tax=Streptomyces sp. NBC_00111 TaxID=2975655 RepID=UPI00324B786F
MIFGFAQNDSGSYDIASTPEEVADQVESTVTVSGGQTWTDPNTGDTYTTD